VSPAARLAVALTAVQALGALTWVVYATLLSGLLSAAGVDPAWRPWILLADQILFAVSDALAGVWLDRAAAATRRLGPPLLLATAVATVAFLALPWLADAPGILLACIAVWAAASSALRAPLPRLLARYTALPERPGLASFLALGTGAAGLLAPAAMLALARDGIRVTFAVTSLTLWLLVAMLFATERSAGAPAPPAATERWEAPPRALPLVLGATTLAALGAQVFATFAAGPALRRALGAVEAGDYATAFPLGVVLASLTAPMAKKFGPVPTGATGCALAAVGAAASAVAGGAATAGAVAAAGAGWGAALTATLTAVTALAPKERTARWTGAWFAAQALATALRMAAGMAAGRVDGGAAAVGAAVAWAAAGAMLAATGARRPALP